ncbi:unnamed protein product [Mytilus coruscus]|uniref:Uncharacterized protein n=1 Tax=Mytilus coruscus TaxID=42192 RepID=A0A6J8CJK2_MYTCO|nr:unnamed protein product [Mytilus coruscus]
MGDKKNKKSTADILKESRHVLYGDEVEVATVLENVLTLLNRMDTRLLSIEKNTGKNTSTLTQMNDKLNSLTARVITAETDIVNVKSRVSDLEASTEGTGNLFDDVKSKTYSLEKEIEQLKRSHGDENDTQENMKDELRKLESYNEKLKGKLLDIQWRNLRGTYYGVNEQFPPEIEEQRRKLYPIAKEARKKKLKVVMKRDKLYINDKLVKPDEVPDDTEHKEPHRSTTRPNKRSRVNSTPEREGT